MKYFLFVLLVTASQANARLGETLEQIAQRYGEPVCRNGMYVGGKAVIKAPGNSYHKDGFYVYVLFEKGQVVSEFYQRPAPAVPLADTEVATFMAVNGQGVRWDDPTKGRALDAKQEEGERVCFRSDGKAVARIFRKGADWTALEISTAEHFNREVDQQLQILRGKLKTLLPHGF